LEDQKKDYHNKLVGAKYNMDERKKIANEGRAAVNTAKATV
jgi:hypothetical protein